MKFVKAMKIKRRICEQTSCMGCILNEKKGTTCNQLMELYPQQAEKILIEWDKEHPIKTNLDELREHFGLSEVDYFNISGCHFIKCNNRSCSSCEYENFWEKEYKKQ